MQKAKQYHLNFRVISSEDEGKWPEIFCNLDSSGSTINDSIASFIGGMGPEWIDHTIYEIISEDPFNKSLFEYGVNGSYDEVVEISSPPAVAIFNDGVVIPLQDFLAILQEWKDFLNSLPYQHILSNK